MAWNWNPSAQIKKVHLEQKRGETSAYNQFSLINLRPRNQNVLIKFPSRFVEPKIQNKTKGLVRNLFGIEINEKWRFKRVNIQIIYRRLWIRFLNISKTLWYSRALSCACVFWTCLKPLSSYQSVVTRAVCLTLWRRGLCTRVRANVKSRFQPFLSNLVHSEQVV